MKKVLAAYAAVAVWGLVGRLAIFLGVPIVLDATVDVSHTVNTLMWIAGIAGAIWVTIMYGLAIIALAAASRVSDQLTPTINKRRFK